MSSEIVSPIELWTEWEIFKGKDGEIVYAFSQQFPPDGIFVEISIRYRSGNYEVWSVSEHRTSGPYENLVGAVQTLEEALELSEEKLRDWEKHLLGVISFYRLEDDYGCFSNFARYPIELKSKTWPTSEHYFQAQKFVGTEHEEEVRLTESPRIAAQMGRDRNRPLRSDWEMVKDDVMREAVMAKFTQHLELQDILLGTGYSLLIEHTENDSYWGDGGNGKGKNMLGRVLMEIREKMKAGV
jgi:ribA/ribD-fused uncharacterized protein